MTIVAILVATGVPWFASGFEVDVGTASWGLLALGGIHMAFSLLASAARSIGRWRPRALTLLNALGVMVIGFIWQHVGGLQNPMFLTVFALPVVGAIFLSRWHPYLLAAFSVLVVCAVALIQTPELRWFVSGALGHDAWLNPLPGTRATLPETFFAGFYAPVSYLVVLLEVFAILLFACAVAAEYVGTLFERLNANIVLARTDAELSQKTWSDLIERLPLPALLVDPYTLRIAACSAAASTYLRVGELPLEGRYLLDALRFSYPDAIQGLIQGADGESHATVLRISDDIRMTQVRVMQVSHRERRLALMTIEDRTDLFYFKTALDASEYAALVIDARGYVLAFNTLAGGLFSGLRVGADAAHLMAQPEGASVWWDPGLAGRRKAHVQIGRRIYQITCAANALAGEEERIFSVALLPVANAEGSDTSATASTLVTALRGGRPR